MISIEIMRGRRKIGAHKKIAQQAEEGDFYCEHLAQSDHSFGWEREKLVSPQGSTRMPTFTGGVLLHQVLQGQF